MSSANTFDAGVVTAFAELLEPLTEATETPEAMIAPSCRSRMLI